MTSPTLLTMPMPDGSRCFYAPEYDLKPSAMRLLVSNLPGVKLRGTMDCDSAGSCWFEFEIDEWRFQVHNPFPTGAFWFIAVNPETDERILTQFVGHLDSLAATW